MIQKAEAKTMARQKQTQLPGTERKEDKELTALQLAYEQERDARIAQQKDEKTALDALKARCDALGLRPTIEPGKKEHIVYVTEDDDGIEHELYWSAEMKLKSRKRSAPDDGPIG